MKAHTIAGSGNSKAGAFIAIDPEILGGEPVFRGTRVPVATLFEHLEGNSPLDEFLENFPSVSREVAVGVLMLSHQSAIEKVKR